jgi:hypothetical protein
VGVVLSVTRAFLFVGLFFAACFVCLFLILPNPYESMLAPDMRAGSLGMQTAGKTGSGKPVQFISAVEPVCGRVDLSVAPGHPGILYCAMTRKTERLCDPGERRHLATMIETYFNLQDQSGRFDNPDKHWRVMLGVPVVPPKIHARVLAELEKLAENGYLARFDFKLLPAPEISGLTFRSYWSPAACQRSS